MGHRPITRLVTAAKEMEYLLHRPRVWEGDLTGHRYEQIVIASI